MPRRPSRRSRIDDDDSESSLSLSCNSAGVENSDASFYSDLDSSDDSSSAEEVIIGDYSAGGASSREEDGSVAWKEEESSSGEEEEGSGSSFSGEESSDLFSEKDSDVGSVHYLYPHSASYRENDSSSRSSDGSVSSLDGDDDEEDEKGSSDENSINEAAVGSAKRFYLDEKFRGSVLKEKKREHIPLLRAMISSVTSLRLLYLCILFNITLHLSLVTRHRWSKGRYHIYHTHRKLGNVALSLPRHHLTNNWSLRTPRAEPNSVAVGTTARVVINPVKQAWFV